MNRMKHQTPKRLHTAHEKSAVSSLLGSAQITSSKAVKDFDCPIRAGPNGSQFCGWKPAKNSTSGFPSIARMKEHVGSHGLKCLDCKRVFTVPSRYKTHRQHRSETGQCSEINAEKRHCPYVIALQPDVVEAFFKRPTKEAKSEHHVWTEGYKILHPDAAYQISLPSPSYQENRQRENLEHLNVSLAARGKPSTDSHADEKFDDFEGSEHVDPLRETPSQPTQPTQPSSTFTLTDGGIDELMANYIAPDDLNGSLEHVDWSVVTDPDLIWAYDADLHLPTKPENTEHQKVKLRMVLAMIRHEIDSWEQSGERMIDLYKRLDALDERLRNIRQLLADMDETK